jgi:hypothetical protein
MDPEKQNQCKERCNIQKDKKQNCLEEDRSKRPTMEYAVQTLLSAND